MLVKTSQGEIVQKTQLPFDELPEILALVDLIDKVVPKALKCRDGKIGELAWALKDLCLNKKVVFTAYGAQEKDVLIGCQIQGTRPQQIATAIKIAGLPCWLCSAVNPYAAYIHLK